jgi:transcriptional regulator with XRE-family HTH domain
MDGEEAGSEDLFGARLKEVVALFPSQKEAAAAAGVSPSTWRRWETGEADPGFSALRRLADDTGISLDWLGGQGSKFRMDSWDNTVINPVTGIPAALAGDVADGLHRVHLAEGHRLPARGFGEQIARLLNELLSTYDTPAEQEVALKILLKQYRDRVRNGS